MPFVPLNLSRTGDVCSALHAPGNRFYAFPPTVSTERQNWPRRRAQESASVGTALLGSIDMLNLNCGRTDEMQIRCHRSGAEAQLEG